MDKIDISYCISHPCKIHLTVISYTVHQTAVPKSAVHHLSNHPPLQH